MKLILLGATEGCKPICFRQVLVGPWCFKSIGDHDQYVKKHVVDIINGTETSMFDTKQINYVLYISIWKTLLLKNNI